MNNINFNFKCLRSKDDYLLRNVPNFLNEVCSIKTKEYQNRQNEIQLTSKRIMMWHHKAKHIKKGVDFAGHFQYQYKISII